MCIFCEIVKGNINSYKIYEDDNFIAFLDLSQQTKGHTLVVSKKHFDNLLALGEEESKELVKAVKNVSKILINKLHCDGINFLSNCNEAAGQTVMHFHMHLLPQYKGKEVKIEPSGSGYKDEIVDIYNTLTK